MLDDQPSTCIIMMSFPSYQLERTVKPVIALRVRYLAPYFFFFSDSARARV